MTWIPPTAGSVQCCCSKWFPQDRQQTLSNLLFPNDVPRVRPGQRDAVRSIFQCYCFCGDLHLQAFVFEIKPNFSEVCVEFLILHFLRSNELPIDHNSCEEQRSRSCLNLGAPLKDLEFWSQQGIQWDWQKQVAILTVKKFFLITHAYSEFHLLHLISVTSCPLAMYLLWLFFS